VGSNRRAQKLPSHARQIAALFKIDRIFRSCLAWFGHRARLHFHKSEHPAIVGDDVEFPFDAGRSEFRAITM
jgi:hypothetical protein